MCCYILDHNILIMQCYCKVDLQWNSLYYFSFKCKWRKNSNAKYFRTNHVVPLGIVVYEGKVSQGLLKKKKINTAPNVTALKIHLKQLVDQLVVFILEGHHDLCCVRISFVSYRHVCVYIYTFIWVRQYYYEVGAFQVMGRHHIAYHLLQAYAISDNKWCTQYS